MPDRPAPTTRTSTWRGGGGSGRAPPVPGGGAPARARRVAGGADARQAGADDQHVDVAGGVGLRHGSPCPERGDPDTVLDTMSSKSTARRADGRTAAARGAGR